MRHAIVPRPTVRRGTGQAALDDQIRAVAAIDASDTDFISCYLDLSAGRAACEDFVARRAAEVRATLQDTVRLDFECAVESIHEAMQALWGSGVGPQTGSVALFARGIGADQELRVIRVGEALEPRLLFNRIPDLVPLARLDRKQQAFTLVLGRRGGLQLLDIQGDRVTPRAWAAYRRARDKPGTHSEIVLPERGFQVMRRMLSRDSSTPLVIAGDANCLDELTSALPARAAGRLGDVLRVPVHLDQQEAIEHVRQRLGRHLDRKDREITDRLLRTVRECGLAVVGPVAAFEALRAGAAETLVLDAGQAPATAWRCEDCGALQTDTSGVDTCDACGGSWTQGGWAQAELVRLAYRGGVPVRFAASAELRDLGGAGCLLREPVEIEIVPRPVAEARALDLVA